MQVKWPCARVWLKLILFRHALKVDDKLLFDFNKANVPNVVEKVQSIIIKRTKKQKLENNNSDKKTFFLR